MIFFDPFDITTPMETQDWREFDRVLHLPSNEQLRTLAAIIDRNHLGQRDMTEAWRSIEHRFIGLFGERAFGRIFALGMDTRVLKHGNRRKNFTLSNGWVVDVVTRSWGMLGRNMPELTIRQGGKSGKTDALCLVFYNGEEIEPNLVGWISKREAQAVGRIDEFREGIVNLVVPIGALHPMSELLEKHNAESAWLEAHRRNQRRSAKSAAQEAGRETPVPTIVQRGLFD